MGYNYYDRHRAQDTLSAQDDARISAKVKRNNGKRVTKKKNISSPKEKPIQIALSLPSQMHGVQQTLFEILNYQKYKTPQQHEAEEYYQNDEPYAKRSH